MLQRNFTLRKNIAFTLAEILITLGIIGVVASLTIPTLIANYQKHEYVVGFKKAYSLWNQSLLQMALDAGTPGDLSSFFDSSSKTIMGDKLTSYFKILKNCSTTETGCFADTIATKIDGSGLLNGQDGTNRYRFVTQDGVAYSLTDFYAGCTADGAAKNCVSSFLMDVNGQNKPNIVGRDIFFLAIRNDRGPRLYPSGGSENSYYWRSSIGGPPRTCYSENPIGIYCAGRIVEENWEMNY